MTIVAIGATLCALRYDVLSLPPYWDQTTLWHEADYLARTGFDYRALWAEPKEFEGGWPAYLTSVLPTFVALLMKASPTPEVSFAAYHVFCFLCTAVILLSTYDVLRHRLTIGAAAMTCLAMFTTPLFSAQVDMLALEIPTTAAAAVFLALVVRQRYQAATWVSLFAFSLKANATLLNLAFLTFLVCQWLLGAIPTQLGIRRGFVIPLLANVACVAFEIGLSVVCGTTSSMVIFDRDPYSDPDMILWLSPDLLLILVAATLIWVIRVSAWENYGGGYRCTTAQAGGRLRRSLARFVLENPDVVLSAIVLAGMTAALYRTYYMPRYVFLALPFLFVFLGRAVTCVTWTRPAAVPILGVIVLLNVANRNGALFPELPYVLADKRNWGRVGSLWERSHEYRQDLDANRRMARELEQRFPDAIFMTQYPFNFFLRLPSFGYVRRPLKILDVDAPGRYSFRYPTLSRAITENPGENVIYVCVVSTPTDREAIDQGTVVFDDRLDPPIVASKLRLPADPLARIRWYLDYAPQVDEPYSAWLTAIRRVNVVRESGRFDALLAELTASIKRFPCEPEFRRALAVTALIQGDNAQADAACDDLLCIDPLSADGHALRWLIDHVFQVQDPRGFRCDHKRLRAAIARLEQARATSVPASVRNRVGDAHIPGAKPTSCDTELSEMRDSVQWEDENMAALFRASAAVLAEQIPAAIAELHGPSGSGTTEPAALSLRGVLKLADDRRQDGLHDLERASKAGHLSPATALALAYALICEGQYERSAQLLESAARETPASVPVLYYLAIDRVLTNQLDEASQVAHEAIHARADDARFHYLAGIIDCKRMQFEQAGHEFKRTLELMPEFRAARKALDRLRSRAKAP